MGNGASSEESAATPGGADLQHHFSGSSSSSSIGPDGKVKLYHDTFTGSGRDGLFNGTGYAYHNVLPVLASLTFDAICIFSIALFSIMLIKFTKSRRRAAAEAANEKYRKLTAEFADTHVV